MYYRLQLCIFFTKLIFRITTTCWKLTSIPCQYKVLINVFSLSHNRPKAVHYKLDAVSVLFKALHSESQLFCIMIVKFLFFVPEALLEIFKWRKLFLLLFIYMSMQSWLFSKTEDAMFSNIFGMTTHFEFKFKWHIIQ